MADTVQKMREMAKEGYEPKQIGLKLIRPRMGRKVSAKKIKVSVAEKAKQKLRISLLRKKAQANGKA